MSEPVLGTIDGDTVRLDKPLPIPTGARVEIIVRPLHDSNRPRPRVGEMTGPRFTVPDEALAPLTEDELQEWGL